MDQNFELFYFISATIFHKSVFQDFLWWISHFGRKLFKFTSPVL